MSLWIVFSTPNSQVFLKLYRSKTFRNFWCCLQCVAPASNVWPLHGTAGKVKSYTWLWVPWRGESILVLINDEKHVFLISVLLPSADDAGRGSIGLHLLSRSQKFLCVSHQPTSFSPFFQNCFSFSFNLQSFVTPDWLAFTSFCRSSIVLCLLFFNTLIGLSWASIVGWLLGFLDGVGDVPGCCEKVELSFWM